jgi:DNA topoisomerase II
MMGGKDAASPRYIFTKLSELSQYVIPRLDNIPITQPKYEDGQEIEPIYYYPIIPLSPVNEMNVIGYNAENISIMRSKIQQPILL